MSIREKTYLNLVVAVVLETKGLHYLSRLKRLFLCLDSQHPYILLYKNALLYNAMPPKIVSRALLYLSDHSRSGRTDDRKSYSGTLLVNVRAFFKITQIVGHEEYLGHL